MFYAYFERNVEDLCLAVIASNVLTLSVYLRYDIPALWLVVG